MQAITAYKVMGGWTATSMITGAGAAIGRGTAIAANKPLAGVWRDACIGGAIAAVPSGVIGLWVAKKPNLKSAGWTQAITSGLGLIGYLIGLGLTPIGLSAIAQHPRELPDNRRLNLGPGGSCVCQSCGAVLPHDTGKACFLITCPNCGAPMTRQTQRILA